MIEEHPTSNGPPIYKILSSIINYDTVHYTTHNITPVRRHKNDG